MRRWIFGTEVTAPAAATQLLKITPSAGRIGLIYGYHYVCQEGTAAGKVARVRLNIAGTAVVALTLDVAANSNPFVSADALLALAGNGLDFIEVVNVVAGTAATIHRAGLLYEEVDGTAPVISVTPFDYRKYPGGG